MAVSRYVTLRAIKHSGNDFAVGTPVALSDEYAAPLLAIGAIQAQAGALPAMPTAAGSVVRESLDTGSGAKAKSYVEAISSAEGLGNIVALVRALDPIISGVITRDANGAALSAPVTFPDGVTGAYTALVVSSAFPGAVDSYQVTYGTDVYTQPAVTRNAAGAVTVRPPLNFVKGA